MQSDQLAISIYQLKPFKLVAFLTANFAMLIFQ
jgi:hypothetical protein